MKATLPPEGGSRREADSWRADSRRRTADTTAEIIFTSGATAEPKGVVITHRNILANIVPIEREVAKYKKCARPFLPIRFLNLLPLSHMFGQAMATFVPPMLPGVVVFTRSYAPEDIVRQIRDRRISVLVSVPKILEVLKEHVLRVAPEAADAPVTDALGETLVEVPPHPPDVRLQVLGDGGRRRTARSGARGLLGAARVSRRPGLRAHRNRPDRHAESSASMPSRGAVGKPIAGVEVRIAEDGEILVRGDNVTQRVLQRAGGDAGVVQGRLVSHRRHRRARREGPAAHSRPQEGNDRHAGRS